MTHTQIDCLMKMAGLPKNVGFTVKTPEQKKMFASLQRKKLVRVVKVHRPHPTQQGIWIPKHIAVLTAKGRKLAKQLAK